MKLSLVTLVGTKVDEEVYSVSIPTTDSRNFRFPKPRAASDDCTGRRDYRAST
ncbi:hypothetical protein KOY49_01920 [Candidatus Minimicrobia vallesae]|uniref:Uncharacterized protein n=1 Tax=Candidatus Minimicrobia vallesae TaxID=2841264 RepID=A0A8F1SB82_9BACT|nr:hypothetical protein [Candidatus Minimicrobia vallesae]QWQ31739.1 hypothetical protein KOY49_01920 [Candidatus Minimicrobia vallesae]